MIQNILLLLMLANLSTSQDITDQTLTQSGICPLQYQSKSLHAYQWFNIFTLCLTPLAVHIAGGVSTPVLLDGKKPHWTQRLPLFNPISILWRYYAIADRRVRWAGKWDGTVMAASNAIFWHDGHWDGSEEMIEESSHYLATSLAAIRVDLLSVSTTTSVIVAVQGAAAIYWVGIGISGDAATFFAPLAIFGLYRLQSALWLSNDVVYSESRLVGTEKHSVPSPRFQCVSWAGLLFRVWWLGSVLALPALSIDSMVADNTCGSCISVSSLAQNVFYLVLTLGMAGIPAFYVLRGKSRTTIIPCIQSTWYKVHTYIVILSAVSCIVLSCLETRSSKCGGIFEGTYTTCPASGNFCRF